jgi:hypothetical protein
MNTDEVWYVVRQTTGHCAIVPAGHLPEAPAPEAGTESDDPPIEKRWGPFDSQADAIARRVGLIRAGKCQPH